MSAADNVNVYAYESVCNPGEVVVEIDTSVAVHIMCNDGVVAYIDAEGRATVSDEATAVPTDEVLPETVVDEPIEPEPTVEP